MGHTKGDSAKVKVAVFPHNEYVTKHGEDKAKENASVIVMELHSLHDDKTTKAYDG